MLGVLEDRSARRDVLLLAIATLACLLPFIGKAVHLDDPVYIKIAQQISKAPLDFFGFEINWHGGLVPIQQFNRNPPGVSYLLAAAGWLGGWSEVSLHLGLVPFGLLTVLGTYALARRFCREPLFATAIACATPAVLVSATTLMADIPMLAGWVWALVFWDRGMRTGERSAFFAAAILVALAALTKFIAVALIPLLLGWSIARELRPRAYTLWMLLPIALLAGFEAYSIRLYGRGILIDAAGYAADMGTRTPLSERLFTALCFVGGTLATLALYLPWVGSMRARLATFLALPTMLVVVLAMGQLGFTPIRFPQGVIRWDIAMQAGVFAGAGVALIACALPEFAQARRDGAGWMLAAWVLGIFAFAGVINWTVSTRVVLPMAPALGILIARRLEGEKILTSKWRYAPLVLGLAMSLVIARADFDWAQSAKVAARDLAQRYGEGGPLQFQGHWGFQYYFEQAGAKPFNLKKRRVIPGATLVEPCNNTNVVPFPQDFGRFVETARYASSRWVTVHSPARGAGFYASSFGPLPWSLGGASDEAYDVLLLQPSTGNPKERKMRMCGFDGMSAS